MKKLAALLIGMSLVPSLFAQAGGTPQTVTVTLTSAQVQSLKASPVTLIPAPGVGNYLNIVAVVLQYKAGSTPYAVPSGGHFSLLLGVGGSASGPIESSDLSATGFLDQSQNHSRVPRISSIANAQSNLENRALMVTNDGGAEWTAGDGTIVVTVNYNVVALQ
jgi:hypothetical protein